MSEQPMPTPNEHPASWDLVLQDIASSYKGPVYREICDDINSRDAMGEKKYKTRLKPFNGRDSLQDAYEESLDLTVYLKNTHSEGFPTYMLYREALRMAISIKEIMIKKSGV